MFKNTLLRKASVPASVMLQTHHQKFTQTVRLGKKKIRALFFHTSLFYLLDYAWISSHARAYFPPLQDLMGKTLRIHNQAWLELWP